MTTAGQVKNLAFSAMILATCVLISSIDGQVDLKEKFIIQSSGISYLLDMYSDAVIVALLLFQVVQKIECPIIGAKHSSSQENDSIIQEWASTSKPLKMSYIGAINFGLVATAFHALGEISHPCFSCYFSAVGAFILYWHARGLIELCTNDDKKALFCEKIKMHFACLGFMPIILCVLGALAIFDRFLFNGYAFFYSAVGMDPLLRQAINDHHEHASLSLKLKSIRLLFPLIGASYIAESFFVELLNIDMHSIIHVLVFGYVTLIHSCLSSPSSV